MTAGLPDTHFQNDLLLGTSFTTVRPRSASCGR